MSPDGPAEVRLFVNENRYCMDCREAMQCSEWCSYHAERLVAPGGTAGESKEMIKALAGAIKAGASG
ncbi:hypothetical protein C3Z06_15915 [Cupriavidus metallidurans]|nr:hypothetical protein C3Z06_15915 [Cupriavidus metallidurans]